jgi:hypothetical protein
MFEFIAAGPNLAFSVALAVMLSLAVLEVLTTFVGASLSSLLDQIIPDMDVDADVDIDADMDADIGPSAGAGGGDALSKLLGWFYVGKVPFLILLVLWLTVFGLVGLVGQSIAVAVTGTLLPGIAAAALAFLLALPLVRFCAAGFARLIPKEETSAISEASFVGRTATVTLGEARAGEPAQAKLTDEFGQDHYVMVEPRGAETLPAGTTVRIVARSGATFTAIATHTQAALQESG